jgi:hypothetical protein
VSFELEQGSLKGIFRKGYGWERGQGFRVDGDGQGEEGGVGEESVEFGV